MSPRRTTTTTTTTTTPRVLSAREQKELLVCYDVANLGHVSEHRAAQVLNVSRATLKTLLDNRAAVEGGRRETDDRRAMTLDDVEKCLFRFFVHAVGTNAPATDDVLLARAGTIAARFGLDNFVPTAAWLVYWKYKNGVLPSRVADCGRAADDRWLLDLVRYARAGYRADRVYGLVETGLYRWVADVGGERRAQRLSVVFLCNVTGTDKKRPLVIDRDESGDRGNATSFNPLKTVHYTTFLKRWSHELWPNNVLLVLDNRSAHPTVSFRNVEIRYLPKNVVHPLGRHIARVAKTYEDRCREPHTAVRWDYTVSEYVGALLNTWDRVSPAVVRDCFRTIGFECGTPEQRADGPDVNPRDGRQQQQTVPLNLCKKDARMTNGGRP